MRRLYFVLSAIVASTTVIAGVDTAHAADVKYLKQPGSFPLTISQPGSYRLRSNIVIPNANTTGILVTADDVTLDLNGWTVRGVTVCTGSPVTSCTPTGTGNGIDGAGVSNLVVKNGAVRGAGNVGVRLSPGDSVVRNVQAISNGSNGITTATATDSVAYSNGDVGIEAYGPVANCRTRSNGFSGIKAWTVLNSVAQENAFLGIDAQTVIGAYVLSNQDAGIGARVAIGTAAVLNTAQGVNANSVSDAYAALNGSAGILASNARNAYSVANTGPGMAITAAGGYGECVVESNTGGTVSGGTPLGGNLCDSSTSCP
jgi:hypothetical protein